MANLQHLVADGTTKTIKTANKPSLKELQDLVGGYIEVVRTLDGLVLVVDEEGRLSGKSVNVAASKLAGQVIVGDAVLMRSSDLE